jgi:leucyl-tRNA synthetase
VAKDSYQHEEIEKNAQEKWASLKLYETNLEGEDPYYLLVEFPYPSGDLHIGHWYAFSLTDIYARYMRMKGKTVLFPIGFDAFGLPAENAAIRNNVDPKEWTYKNMDRMRAQIKSMGTTFDWSKEVVTCDPAYYRFTQWLFGKLYEHNLAYRAEAPVKWCPKDQTVLANEQVVDGACERCGTDVEEKRLTQWFMKITEYADRLLKDLEPLPWREEIKEAQRAWIGESEGARLFFDVPALNEKIEVFTTRPDTVFGATYVVLAPELPLVDRLLEKVENRSDVEAYRQATSRKTERERSEHKEKTGVKLKGMLAINPATKEEVPIYIADYALASYGTGAVMAVPAHDERDNEFAKRHGLLVRHVILEPNGTPHPEGQFRKVAIGILENENGEVLIQSQEKDSVKRYCWPGGGIDEGETDEEGALREVREKTGFQEFKSVRSLGLVEGHYYNPIRKVWRTSYEAGYHMRVQGNATGATEYTDHEKQLIIEHLWVSPAQARKLLSTGGVMGSGDLPFLDRFEGKESYTGDGTLAYSGPFTGRHNREAFWDIVKYCGGEKTTNYRIRDWLVSRQRYWGCPIPIVYDPGGKPHLIPNEHLPWELPTDVDFTPTGEAPLASSKELKERVTRIFGEGWTPEYDTLDTFVDSSWYFLRYLAPNDEEKFSDASLMKKWLPVDRYSGGSEHTTMHLLYARFFHKALFDLSLVPTPEPFNERFNRGIILGPDGAKMSKSKGNVVNPDEFVGKYGADAVRMYLAFIGPYNEAGSYPWALEGVASMRKFLNRVYALRDKVGDVSESEALMRAEHEAVRKVGVDTERFKFNTAISALMVLVREAEKEEALSKRFFLVLVSLLAPYAPHLGEHMYEALGEKESVHKEAWPEEGGTTRTLDVIEITVQVNGKRKASLTLSPDADEKTALEKAVQLPKVREALGNQAPGRVIYVKGRILNLVSKP